MQDMALRTLWSRTDMTREEIAEVVGIPLAEVKVRDPGCLTIDEIALLLRRPVGAVKVRASRLKLGRRAMRGRQQKMEDTPSREAAQATAGDAVAGQVNCLSRISPHCLKVFWSEDRKRIRICPNCKRSPEFEGAQTLADTS